MEKVHDLIETKKQLDALRDRYADLRSQVYAELLESGKDSLEADGYRIARAKPYITRTYSRESIERAARQLLSLSPAELHDFLAAAQNETEVSGDIVIRAIKQE